jgi:hypothetical protein
MAVDPRLRDYLIRAHNKVIAHYRQLLQASSLSEPERLRIQGNLASVEAEAASLRRDITYADAFPRLAA